MQFITVIPKGRGLSTPSFFVRRTSNTARNGDSHIPMQNIVPNVGATIAEPTSDIMPFKIRQPTATDYVCVFFAAIAVAGYLEQMLLITCSTAAGTRNEAGYLWTFAVMPMAACGRCVVGWWLAGLACLLAGWLAWFFSFSSLFSVHNYNK